MPSSLKLLDYSDRELLLLVADAADPNEGGAADSRTIAKVVGVSGQRKHQAVGSRMSWLRRYGAVEGEVRKGRMFWRLTPMGEILARGELRKTDREALDRLKPEQMLMVTREIARRQRKAPETAGHLMRREWFRSTHVNGK